MSPSFWVPSWSKATPQFHLHVGAQAAVAGVLAALVVHVTEVVVAHGPRKSARSHESGAWVQRSQARGATVVAVAPRWRTSALKAKAAE